MKAIVDCNNFYCSCERLFKPHLENRPVVVLSNNDGCIISRSDEAKKIGIAMAGPYFQAKPIIEKNGIEVFSSNYNLYGDLSWRVMETLRIMMGEKNVEVYSVDEAFIDLTSFSGTDWQQLAKQIRETVEQWTGIKVSVGIAPTKVLAKLANRISKKDKKQTNCITVLDTEEKIVSALHSTPVGDVWGVGSQYARKLQEQWGIQNALQLRNISEEFAKKYLGGVTGVRLVKELKGQQAKDMEEELTVKKMIATTRMFGSPVSDINDIKEAVATYTSRAAEKLRRQFSAAKIISVFVVKKEQDYQLNFRQSGTISTSSILPMATCLTQQLIKPALELVDKIYEKGNQYKKAGVMLSGITPDNSKQGNLFFSETKNSERKLMDMIDNINFSQRDDLLKFAASGTRRDWKMRQELRSRKYTTRWEELYLVK